MKKRGLSHIEVLFSFLIFVGFVMLAFYFFSPFRSGRLVDTSLDYAMREVKKSVFVEVESFSYKLDVKDLVDAGESIGRIQIDNIGALKKVAVKNRDEAKVAAKRDGNNVDFEIGGVYEAGLPEEDPEKGFAVFMFSEDFEEDVIIDGTDLGVGKDLKTSYSKKEIVSEKKIKELKINYDDNYENVKTQFNLPSRANFEFALIFSLTEKIDVDRPRPEGIEIFSKMERVEVLREGNNNIEFADLVVRVW